MCSEGRLGVLGRLRLLMRGVTTGRRVWYNVVLMANGDSRVVVDPLDVKSQEVVVIERQSGDGRLLV